MGKYNQFMADALHITLNCYLLRQMERTPLELD